MTSPRKKLIEVALPLEAINVAAAREKSIRHGHPSTLHLWWARRPLAACRAVLFASLVDDPNSDPEFRHSPEAAAGKRARLFSLIEELVQWKNSNNEEVLFRARKEIARCVASWKVETGELKDSDRVLGGTSVGDIRLMMPTLPPEAVNEFLATHAPPVHDPFAGGGSIPLEAQRLGLRAYASDLNPVAVLINKAMIEIPPRFAGRPPANPESRAKAGMEGGWSGARGLAEDVRYYGQWMRDEAEKRIGKLYPKVKVAPEMVKTRPDLKPYEGRELTVIAWLWARTVKSPNPAFADVDVPLASTFMLSTKSGKESYVEPVVEEGGYRFLVHSLARLKDETDDDWTERRDAARPKLAVAKNGTKLARGANFRCLMSGIPIPGDHIKAEGVGGRMGSRLMAIVAEGDRGRVYLSPLPEHEAVAERANPTWRPTESLPLEDTANFWCSLYGLTTYGDLFTPRQLVALTTFSDLVGEAMERVRRDAEAGDWPDWTCDASSGAPAASPGSSAEPPERSGKAPRRRGGAPKARGEAPEKRGDVPEGRGESPEALGGAPEKLRKVREPLADAREANAASPRTPPDPRPLREDGSGSTAYAEAVATYMGLVVSRSADRHNTICSWDMGPVNAKSSTGSPARSASVRNAFSRQALPMSWDYAEGNPFSESATNVLDSANWIAKVLERLPSAEFGEASQRDAVTSCVEKAVVSTDPPYYDNIGYADLSDFFYVWLRRSLRGVYPEILSTMAVPKLEELVATPYRHGGRENAERFFLDGMTQVMHRLAEMTNKAIPVTIYYAFKQSETRGDRGTASTGWETFLDAVIRAGFGICGTWPMRTELGSRIIGSGTNALASSIILVCRPCVESPRRASRREFLAALKAELPDALRHLQAGNIAPVDLAQAAIGPGMAVFTRYSGVLEADGSTMSVRTALSLINETLDEVLAEQEGEFDADTRWALAWFEQNGFDEGPYGAAETLCTAKNTSVAGMVEARILHAKGGKVRLLSPEELPEDWDPSNDSRVPVWEMVHHLVRKLESGEEATAELMAKLGNKAEAARDLAYRLYTLCERKKRAREALGYNALVLGWSEVAQLARERKEPERPEEAPKFL